MKNRLETLPDFIGHRHVSYAALGFWTLDVVLHTACSLELFINPYAPILKNEVIFGKPAELGDAQPRIEEDVECLIVAGEMIIVLHEG